VHDFRRSDKRLVCLLLFSPSLHSEIWQEHAPFVGGRARKSKRQRGFSIQRYATPQKPIFGPIDPLWSGWTHISTILKTIIVPSQMGAGTGHIG